MDEGWVDARSAGWQGTAAAAVTPGGADMLHKRGWGGTKGKQMLTISSFLLCPRQGKEAKCTYLGNLLDLGDKLEKCVEARPAEQSIDTLTGVWEMFLQAPSFQIIIHHCHVSVHHP